MKLRVARKVWASVGGPREGDYTHRQLDRAWRRIQRTRERRLDNACFLAICKGLGAEGRARLLARAGQTADAIRLLVDTPEEHWPGDWTDYERLRANG